jgi:hypothetical protein
MTHDLLIQSTLVFLGPNSPVGHGSILPCVEQMTKYMIRMIHKCQTQGIKAVEPEPQAVSDFTEHVDTFMQRTAWATHCRSWYGPHRRLEFCFHLFLMVNC